MDEAEVRAARWRRRAEESRTLADNATNDEVRATYLRMARAYEMLTDHWEKRSEA